MNVNTVLESLLMIGVSFGICCYGIVGGIIYYQNIKIKIREKRIKSSKRASVKMKEKVYVA